MRLRSQIIAALGAGALLLLLIVIAVLLWLVLGALGDDSGATVARVLGLLFGICWFIDLVSLVVLIALGQISESDGKDCVRERE